MTIKAATAGLVSDESGELNSENDLIAVESVVKARDDLATQIGRRIVGQQQVVDQLLVALLCGGHCLFVGVPGLAKTLLVSSLADLLDLSFSRIQFTPDLMPSDITGTDVLQEDSSTGRRYFRFIKGPIFANLVLADEVNRTPPKTQAALLQAMQEQRVSAGGATHELQAPFMVFATQNPIEQEGTYPLPEAQLDRFMFQIDVEYPSEDEEVLVVKQETAATRQPLLKVLGPEEIMRLQQLVRRVPVADHVVRYAVRICRASRPVAASKVRSNGAPAIDARLPELVQHNLSWGAGPRASQFLVLAAKARALLEGRFAPRIEDVRALARPVLKHRLVRNFRAEADGVSAEDIIEQILQVVDP
jgi:MoxR-like ATPase